MTKYKGLVSIIEEDGAVTLPSALIEQLQWYPGTDLSFTQVSGGVLLKKSRKTRRRSVAKF